MQHTLIEAALVEKSEYKDNVNTLWQRQTGLVTVSTLIQWRIYKGGWLWGFFPGQKCS